MKGVDEFIGEAGSLDDLLRSCSQKEQDLEQEVVLDDIPALKSTLEPMFSPQHEKFAHRIVAFHLAEGMTDKEIAEQTGLHPITVGYLKKQPHIQELVLGRIHKNGDKVLRVLHDAALESAKRLIRISETAVNEETKRKANNDILDRVYGKPNQPMSVRQNNLESLPDSELTKIILAEKRN